MFLIFFLTLFSNVYSINNNMNGDIYDISNPNISSFKKFSTIYSEINKNSEYFDVYSPPITSRYGDVYWTMMEPVNLPRNIINKFANKTMAVVGYEVDQVFRTKNGDIPFPITWAYNHHYEAYLRNSESSIIKLNDTDKDKGQYNHGAHKLWGFSSNGNNNRIGKNILFFSEGNGGEFRGSFHGYPNNYAQLINSPRYFNIQPMQIDTRNRDPKYINDPNFHPGLLPKRSAAPLDASYSGLLECPCTDRIVKNITHNYNTLIEGYCAKEIENITECLEQAIKIGSEPINKVFHYPVYDKSKPYGCSFVQNEKDETVNITLNNYNSKVKCGGNSNLYSGFISRDQITNISLNITIDLTKNKNERVNISIEGPNDLWFGIAFNAYSMSSLPYSIIVNGSGYIFEEKLGNHDPGYKLNRSFTVLSNSLLNNRRRVVISRGMHGLSSDYYTFNLSESNIPILTAVGYKGNFAYHHLKSTNNILLKSIDKSTCICNNGIKGTINGITFSKNCLPEPRGDLIEQENPSCFVDKYQGGLSCCRHKTILLDKNQEQPEHKMTYNLKFRFWFQEYKNHLSLERFYYQTESYSGEYDIPKCPEDIPSNECVHSITAHWNARDMIDNNLIGNSSGFELIYAGPHCHAPTCLSMELYDSDTGNLLCRVDGILGEGNNTKKYDERGYIRLNPCLWGYDNGLLRPKFFNWNNNFTSIKINNNTYAHYGEMASWQMRGVIIN